MARRDLRSGAMALMAVAILISVSAVTAVGLLASRVEQALLRDAQSSLGADRLLVADRAIPSAWREAAATAGVQSVEGLQFPTMVLANGRAQLSALKAVGLGYPLRGQLELGTTEGRTTQATLERGEAWVDPSLLSRLSLKVGDTMALGGKAFRISAAILYEPDRGVNFVNLSPRVMVRIEDIGETDLLGPGSRVSRRFWVAADQPAALATFDRLVADTMGAGQRIETIDNARPELREALDRANGFLALTGMVSVLTACAAMGLAARRMGRLYRSRLAVMKVLGATRSTLRRYWFFTLMAGGATLPGLLAGWLVQLGLAAMLASLLTVPLPALSMAATWVLLQAAGMSFLMTLVFAWPALVMATEASPVEALREQGAAVGKASRLWLAVAALGLAGLLWLGSGDLLMAALVVVLFGVFGLLVGLLLWSGFRGLGELLPRSWSGWEWMSLRRACRRRTASMVAQVLGLGLALSALFMLSFVRTDLVQAWGRSIPADAPNRFLLNIIPGEEDAVAARLNGLLKSPVGLAPMVRGRLIGINGKPIGPEQAEDERARRLLDRELNLSYATTLPEYNRIVSGRPLNPALPEVSVEQGIGQTLGIGLGDTLRFDISGEIVEAKVTSIRSLRWDSMAVNFFMILTPSALQEMPKTFITSFYWDASESARLEQALLPSFPSLTMVDLDSLLSQVRRIVNQVVAAIQALFVFSLFSGGLVLVAALLATREERMREAALLRALGASRQALWRAQRMELIVVGGLAGGLSALLAQGVGMVVAQQFFALVVDWRWAPVLIGLALGSGIALLAGRLALRAVLTQPAIAALRQHG
jgi:putative ABC transport system permease protein